MCVGCPIAIRSRRKEKASKTEIVFWRIGLAFNPNHSLQSLTKHTILKNTNMVYETKIKSGKIELAYS